MSEIPSKTYYIGKSKVKIVSPFVALTPEEQKQWFKDEWAKGNPIVHEMVDAATECLLDSNENEEEVS